MRYYFKDTFSAWQTILFFAILLGSTTFILSVFVFNKYTAETELLVISNNINQSRNYRYGDFGSTLKQIVPSEVFLEELNQKTLINLAKNDIKIKHVESTDIIVITVSAISSDRAQQKITALHRYIIKNAQNYFAKNDFITVKTLIKPKLIDRQKLIYQNLLRGAFAGLILGIIVVWFTDFRLNLFKVKKYHSNIVSKKIKEELTKKSKVKNDLYINDEGYIFDKKENAQISKITAKTVKNKRKVLDRKITKLGIKKFPSQKIKAQIISLNSPSPLGADNPSVPENLPVFIREKYNEENNEMMVEGKENLYKKRKEEKKKKVIKKMVRTKKEKPFIKSKLFIKETKNISGKNVFNKEKNGDFNIDEEVGRDKKPSAHNIANGFSVDADITKNLESAEDIKDRLNKLLRGDL